MRWFGRADADYRDEIAEHIELETQANIERGMVPEEAHRAARIAFGGVASVRQQLHRGRRGYWRSAVAQDVRYGLRMIRRNRLLSGVVVLIMGLGIGATTAVFNTVNAVAFAPPVSSDPDSYVQFVADDDTGYQVASRQRYETLRAQARSMRQLAAWSAVSLAAPLGKTDGSVVQGVLVSCNLLTTLSDVPPLAGRLLNEDDCASAAPVAVMSRDLWRRRFTSDPGIVGKSFSYGGHPLTIVGVVAPSALPDGLAAGVWIPYTAGAQLKDLNESMHSMLTDDFPWFGMVGRLAPGYSRRAAAAELRVLTSRETHVNPDYVVGLKSTDGSLWSMAPVDTLWMFSAALAFPTLVTLIVCATVATLLLSRAVKRQREMAIRLAVGGSRVGLVRMLLVENMLLASIAAAVSLTLISFIPPGASFWPGGFFSSMPIRPDWRLVTFMSAMTLFTAVAAGLAPALESLNLRLGESLKGRLVLAGRGITWTRALLVATQVTFSMVLLVAAAGIFRAERYLAKPGFETRYVLSADLQKLNVAHTQASLAALVGSLPGIRSTAYTATLPLVIEGMTTFEASGQLNRVPSAHVSPTYFETLGIRILQGRSFEAADEFRTGEKPVVVSQRFAARFFPGQNSLGHVLTESGPAGKAQRLVIVGVAADRATGFAPMKLPNDGSFVYQLIEPSLRGHMLVRFDGDVNRMTTAFQIRLKEATGWVVPVSTLQTALENRMMTRIREFERWMTAIGAIGLGLALIGVFGLLAFTAVQRRKEIAIRAALGARRTDIFRSMVLPALRPTGVGIVVGAFLSFAALRLAESQRTVPVGLPSIDPVVYLAGGLLLLVAALAAMTPPAYRATRSDPARALRED